MTLAELQKAVRVLELGQRATLREVKAGYRRLVKHCHPDAGGQDPERIRQLNAAYRLVLQYLADYRYCFSPEEFFEQVPEERLRAQFQDDPVWGRDGTGAAEG